jgi:hypothetical protein
MCDVSSGRRQAPLTGRRRGGLAYIASLAARLSLPVDLMRRACSIRAHPTFCDTYRSSTVFAERSVSMCCSVDHS